MDERKLELVVTRENGKIKKVRIRKESNYIYEMLPYLNEFGYIEFKNLVNNIIIETGFGFKHPSLSDLVKPTEELLIEIRTNFLKLKATSGNYHLTVRNKELILDNSSDTYTVGVIKFFDEEIGHTGQEYYNNITGGLRNKEDLVISLNRDGKNDNLLYLYNSDGTKMLDICGINELEIMAMLSDENAISIINHTNIKELIYLIYSKRRLSSVGGRDRCMLGNYILNLKNKESKNEAK